MADLLPAKLIMVKGNYIPTPKSLTVDFQDFDGDGSTRSTNGTMVRDRITMKRKLNMEWGPMTPNEMKKLCLIGDVILPNITEACLLTGYEYKQNNHTEEYISGLIEALVKEGMKNIVLTGVSKQEGRIGAVCYNCNTGKQHFYDQEIIPGYYHGTGDVFASVFTSSLIKGKSLEESTEISVDVTVASIKETLKYENIDVKYGVCFEEVLPLLIDKVK